MEQTWCLVDQLGGYCNNPGREGVALARVFMVEERSGPLLDIFWKQSQEGFLVDWMDNGKARAIIDDSKMVRQQAGRLGLFFAEMVKTADGAGLVGGWRVGTWGWTCL